MNIGLVVFVSVISLGIESSCFRIGAFNLKVFGPTKSGKVHILDYIVKIIHRYDIILLQEIRDSSGESLVKLKKAVNSHGSIQYDSIISERLGDSVSKEQYAFYYRRDRKISVVSSYVYGDPKNEFEREPFIVKFRCLTTEISEFVLAGIHVKPSAAIAEISALETVYTDIVSKMGTENVIFLGDMNAECSYAPKKYLNFIPIRTSSKFHWLISDDVDTTVASGTDCAYDRFILHGEDFLATVVDGSSRVYRFDQEFRLSETAALEVSDHYPIELELRTVTSAAPYIPFTMFTTICLGSVICSCVYCLRG